MKKCIWLISLSLILLLIQNAYAANVTKTKIINQDSYTDTETNFFDEQGNKVFLDQYEGNTVLLVFWASWCGACVGELPALDNLEKDFRNLPFKIIAISEDYQGIERVIKYFTEHEIRHLEVFHDYQNQLFKSMSVNGLPTAFLINSNGKIKKLFKGRIKWYDDAIRAILLAEIDGNPQAPKNSYKFPALNRKVRKTIQTEPNKKDNDNKQEEKNEQQENQEQPKQ